MEEDTSKCVIVRGFPIVDGEQLENLKDKLQIYFQSTKDSGGDDVNHLELLEPGLMKIQFAEVKAAKNVLRRGHHQINVFGKDYALEVLPYSPSSTQLEQPHDVGQLGSTVGANTDQEEHPDNETAGHQSTGDHHMFYSNQTVEEPTFPNSFHPHESVPPKYPQGYPDCAPPTYHLPQAYQQAFFLDGGFESPYWSTPPTYPQGYPGYGPPTYPTYYPHEADQPDTIGPQESAKEKPSNEEEDENKMLVEVTGLTVDEFEERRDVLYYYFENTKRSGGGEISHFKIDSERDRVVITFKEKEAPGRIKQKSTHHVGKRKLNVRIFKSCPELPTVILLKGIADHINKETLFLFLESMSRGEDEPSEVFYGKEAGTFMVAFTEPISDIDLLLARCSGTELEQQTISAEKVHDTDCIQVTGIPLTASRDNLFYYFESTKRSGGGSVTEVRLNKDQGSALIFFDDHTVIERVLEKTHTIQKTTVPVEPFYTCLGTTIPLASFVTAREQFKKTYESPMSARPRERQLQMHDEKDKTMAIEVTGLTGDELQDRRDVLRFYFENTRRSGGGDISKFDIDSKKGRLLMVFKDKDAAGRVMQKSTHEVGKKKLKVRTVKPRPELPVDPTRILLKGLADSVTEETLFLFLEAMCRGQHEVSEIFSGRDAGTIMVAFVEPISDLGSLLARCEGRELEQQTISAEKVHDTDCIQVTGIPSTASRDNLFYYFESTKRSGGGSVSEVQLDKDQGSALIFFDDHTVIERVLKTTHTIQEKTVTVEPFYTSLGTTIPITSFVTAREQFKKVRENPVSVRPKERKLLMERHGEQNKAVAIEVTGLTGDEFEERREVVRLYFENTKRSGGGEISQFDIDSGKSRVVITFKDKEAPGRVMQKSTHQIGKRKLNVRMVKSRPELPMDPTRILLKGIADSVNKETLFLYLESMSRFEDEPAEIFYGKEAGTVMVAFAEPISDLHSLLARCKGRELEQGTVTAEEVHDTDCIQVTGIPSTASRDNLFYYFESTKRSGGGSVSEVQLDKDHGSALVFFDDHTVIDRILKKGHTMQKKTVTVKPFYTCLGATIPIASYLKTRELCKNALESPISARPNGIQLSMEKDEEKGKTLAIEVTGLTGDELEERHEVLRFYFENTKRSGGGDISKFDIDSDKDRVLIVFRDKEAPGRVMQKTTHEVTRKKLTVRTIKLRPELPVDPTRILLKGVADRVTEETLFLFLEAMSRGQDEPSEVFYGRDAGTIMVAFVEPISDLDSLMARCKGRELEQQTISAEKVHDTDCIQVTGIPSTASRDNLFYYFENAKRSGGGSVAEVQLDKDQGTALVLFDEHTVIERVLKQSHTIQKTKVTVEPFYTCLGATVAEAKTPPQLVPLPITENVTPAIASFVMNHPQFKQALDDMMTKAHALISWPVGGNQGSMEISPTLTKKTPNLASIAENWAPNASEGLKSFLARFDTKEIASVMLASWPQVCTLIDDDILKDDDTISVHSTRDRKIIFTGLKDSVAKHYQRVLDGREKIEEDIKRKQSEVQEIISQLKPEQVKLLAMSNFKDRMTSKFPKMQMSFDTDGSKVKFHGLIDEIQQTKVNMFETVCGVTSQSAKLSLTLISFFNGANEPQQHLLSEYKRGNIVAVITTTIGEVKVCGLTDSDVKKAVSILKKTFQEQRLDVSDLSTSVLDTEEWKETKTALEQSAKGMLKISVEKSADSRGTKILFTGESGCVKDMFQRVNNFLRVKTIHEQRVDADDGVIRFIKEYQLSTLQHQLDKHQVSVCFNGSDESPTMTIKGNIDGIQKASSVLKSFIDSVSSDQMSIKKPGMPKHFGKQAVRSTPQLAEKKSKCKNTKAPDPDTFVKQFMPTSQSTVAQKRAQVNLGSGKRLVVWRDDITKHKADAIVNAAGATLDHTGGLAKAIVEAGGDVIQKFCNDYVQANGTLMSGQVVASPPGRINTCQRILHAVGPIWQGGRSGEEDDLADAVYNSLDEAATKNFVSIAIPAISSGVYGYPLKKCAETIVATTIEYLDDNPDTSLDVVEFIDINDQTADAFVDALESVCGKDKVETSYRRFGQRTSSRPYLGRGQRGRGGGSQPGGPYTASPFAPSRHPRYYPLGFRTTEGKAISATRAMDKRTNNQPQGASSTGNIKLPKTWTSMSDDDQYREVELQPTSDEYQKVHDQFMQSVASSSRGYYAVSTAQVLKIKRIQNVTLYHQYMVRKKKMELDNFKSRQPVERILYHGTSAYPIPSINHTGFNRSYTGRNVGAALGNGVYFAMSASLSAADQYSRPDSNGHRYMYMARVLSGDMCKGQQNIIVPPVKDPNRPHILYDSVCDNLANPQIIVIFYDAQAYPEYLITFIK